MGLKMGGIVRSLYKENLDPHMCSPTIEKPGIVSEKFVLQKLWI